MTIREFIIDSFERSPLTVSGYMQELRRTESDLRLCNVVSDILYEHWKQQSTERCKPTAEVCNGDYRSA